MPEPAINSTVEWLKSNLPFFYAIILSLWGGFVQYVNRVRMGETWRWKSMLLDMIVCSFTGILAFFMCQSMGIDGWRAALIIAISAHEGTRTIGIFINWRNKVMGADKP